MKSVGGYCQTAPESMEARASGRYERVLAEWVVVAPVYLFRLGCLR